MVVIVRVRELARVGARIGVSYGGMIALASMARLETELRSRRSPPPEVADPEADVYGRYTRWWAQYQCRVLGISVGVSGMPRPARGPRLIVANHRSPLDIPVLMSLFGGVFLAAEYISTLPVFGSAARNARTIFVDRESTHSGAKALRAMRQILREGRTLVAFPEGITYAGDQVHPFKPGAIMAARAKSLNVEVVPVGLAYPPGLEYVGGPLPSYVKMICETPRLPIELAVGQMRRLEGSRAAILEGLRAEVQDLVHVARAKLGARSP